jgi:hypothetical protein
MRQSAGEVLNRVDMTQKPHLSGTLNDDIQPVAGAQAGPSEPLQGDRDLVLCADARLPTSALYSCVHE